MRRSGLIGDSLLAWGCIVAGVIAFAAVRGYAQSTDSPPASQPLQEVTVTATRALDHKELARAVNGYVASHSAPGARINQIGRWHANVCPLVTGLQTAAAEFVMRKIQTVARGIGAPTAAPGKNCPASVEIVFTRQPQALLDRIAKAYRPLLGFYPASQVTTVTTFRRPIQAWYETATRSMDVQLPIPGMNPSSGPSVEGGPGGDMPLFDGAQVDSDVTATGLQPSGVAGSRLGNRMRSEFRHVLIIADSGRLAGYSLASIADYLAFLSLARMSQLDQCAPLPSITDLLASGCATPVADSLTAADRAYLKGLYSADLEQNLNFERGEVHEQMMRQIEGK
jgi:hypothetical protein